QEGGRDDGAIAEVVDAVADQHGQPAATRLLGIEMVMMVVAVALVVMHMAVELDLLQQPEKQQAAQQHG
ncbi:hypothetical protein, partial [Klebsiella aerogenes]|uniref:hypothetical protein n=1 Tax=Klebsiella aerogenes TaxID=548 RepID=UPI0013D7DB81